MKTIRFILSMLVGLVILAIVAAVGVAIFADRAVKMAVESAGTKTLNVGVEVGKADASILSGSVGFQDIRVANPPDYEGASLLELGRVDVTADAASLLRDQVLIRDMKLENMEVFLEQKGLENNLYEVIEPLRNPREPIGKTLLIDTLEITGIVVHVELPAIPGEPQSVDLTIAPIRMTEVGRNEKMDIAVLITKILLAVSAGVAEQAGDILPAETIGEMTSILDKAIDIGRIIFGPGKTNSDGSQTDSLGKSVTEGLKDLIGGQKKQ